MKDQVEDELEPVSSYMDVDQVQLLNKIMQLESDL